MSAEALFKPQEYIQKTFQGSEEPSDAITTIQRDNRVKIPSVYPALSLLDLHGMSRYEVHQTLFHSLQDSLRSKLESLDTKTIKRLLDKAFQYTSIPQLRLVVMSILETIPQPIDEKYLLEIAEKEDLYADCPLSVKQQIWQLNPGVFGEAVSPLLDQYVAAKETLLFNISDTNVSFFSQPVKQRRQSPILKQLVEMIGSSIPLYNTLCQFLRTLFLRTHVGHYCTLRADIIMILHEQDNVILDSDRCHKFGWCLDACIRAGSLDEKKLRELYSFLDTITGGDEILEDVSMLLRDPFALHTIGHSIIRTLHELMHDNKLPRESQHLESLLRLLCIGLKSPSYLETKSYRGDPLEIDLVIKFLPDLLSFMTEATLKLLYSKLKQEHPNYLPSSNFIRHLTNMLPAIHLACDYALYLLEKKDFRNLSVLLPTIAAAYVDSEKDIFSDGFIHTLVVGVSTQLATLRDNLLLTILKEFFLPCALHSETCFIYLCRLLWIGHTRMKGAIVKEIMDDLQPATDQVSPIAQDQYQALIAHIDGGE